MVETNLFPSLFLLSNFDKSFYRQNHWNGISWILGKIREEEVPVAITIYIDQSLSELK